MTTNSAPLCQCGCGEPAGVYSRADAGHKKGESRRFIPGHQGRVNRGRPKSDKTDEERFWKRVDKKHGPFPKNRKLGRCWIWTGGLNAKGYGTFHINAGTEHEKTIGAHQFAYFLDRGYALRLSSIQPAVLHKCDTPACVRGSHLFTGTQKDNMNAICGRRVAAEQESVPKNGYPSRKSVLVSTVYLKNCKWLEKHGLSGLAKAIKKCPDLFAHIEQEKPHRQPEEWVPIAERVARGNGGLLPRPKRLIDEMNLTGLYQAFRKHPGLFKHLQIEKSNRVRG